MTLIDLGMTILCVVAGLLIVFVIFVVWMNITWYLQYRELDEFHEMVRRAERHGK